MGINSVGNIGPITSEASILTLSKSLKAEKSMAAQLLQGLPGTDSAVAQLVSLRSGLGRRLDAYA